MSINMRRRQNGRHFPDDIYRYIFVNDFFLISISLKFTPKGPIDNDPALVKINVDPIPWRKYAALWEDELILVIALYQRVGKPLPEPMTIKFCDSI